MIFRDLWKSSNNLLVWAMFIRIQRNEVLRGGPLSIRSAQHRKIPSRKHPGGALPFVMVKPLCENETQIGIFGGFLSVNRSRDWFYQVGRDLEHARAVMEKYPEPSAFSSHQAAEHPDFVLLTLEEARENRLSEIARKGERLT